MGMWNNKLFVADIHELIEIDIPGKTILHRYTAENSLFLNDIAIDPKGRVYISDMKKNVIYRFTDGKLEEWLKSDLLVSPNGLFSDQKNMMIGTKNNILKVNIKNKSAQVYIDNTGSIDGLEAIGDGRYIFSDWIGHIHIAGPDTKKILLLDSTLDKINAADIQFIPSKKLVLVPTFLDNRVRAYHLDY
jgi:sugar lactone lactonase YvrE